MWDGFVFTGFVLSAFPEGGEGGAEAGEHRLGPGAHGQPERGQRGEFERSFAEVGEGFARLKERADSGSRLTKLIRSPLEERLEGVEVLIVSGDGLFHMLPLGALPGAEPDSFWLDQPAFASMGNARELLPDPADTSQDSRRELVSALVGGNLATGFYYAYNDLY